MKFSTHVQAGCQKQQTRSTHNSQNVIIPVTNQINAHTCQLYPLIICSNRLLIHWKISNLLLFLFFLVLPASASGFTTLAAIASRILHVVNTNYYPNPAKKSSTSLLQLPALVKTTSANFPRQPFQSGGKLADVKPLIYFFLSPTSVNAHDNSINLPEGSAITPAPLSKAVSVFKGK